MPILSGWCLVTRRRKPEMRFDSDLPVILIADRPQQNSGLPCRRYYFLPDKKKTTPLVVDRPNKIRRLWNGPTSDYESGGPGANPGFGRKVDVV